jgi:hypothetical protein
MLDDVEFRVARLELCPDDVLAVRPAKQLSSVMAAELRAQLERRLNLTVVAKPDAKRAPNKQV